ncbi:MAG: sensor histidine kinase [Hydrogenophilales bacterium 16-64-46]|nr:MAG: sensor histidine kinase [Hydrogenophilales bacterium 12-64-13]OYZ03998.1 MAG: sensor histidine kinase [Hydrogenophilales bacterium 16-64-46]OZA39061.1 MAG: sensor histidine kinase [Hydrogenophilales bacterium 17-64-34]
MVYFAAAHAGLMFAIVGSTVTLVWPPSGIALVAILAFGYRIAPGIALGAFLANAWTGLPLMIAAGIATGNVLEALAGAWLLKRLAGFRNTLDRRRDVFGLIVLAAMCSTMISASLGVASLALGGIVAYGEYASVWLTWWLGDMMGVLVVAPPLLVWLYHPRPVLSPPRVAEAGVLLAALLLVSYLIFATPELAGHGYYPASLAILPFVIWGALRFEHWGAALVTLLISALAIWGATHGTGPFALGTLAESLIGWCIFVNVLAVTGLLLAVFSAEQQRARAAIRSAQEVLEQRVRDRTEQLAKTNAGLRREMAERKRLEAVLIQASEAQQKSIGRELHDGLGQHLTSIAFLGAALQQQLSDRVQPEADAAGRIVELVNQSIDMTRRVARGLYPAALESLGLSAALEQLADNPRSLHGLHCEVHADFEAQRVDPHIAINLYRFAQEAINNAVKHSQAHRLWIDLACDNLQCRLSVRDDGIGFTPEHDGQGLGMHSLRARANMLGGELEITRNAQGGTTVALIYPARMGEQNERRQHKRRQSDQAR